jgi:hypothetical protein
LTLPWSHCSYVSAWASEPVPCAGGGVQQEEWEPGIMGPALDLARVWTRYTLSEPEVL